jgi:dihydroflavonol-4-reductase
MKKPASEPGTPTAATSKRTTALRRTARTLVTGGTGFLGAHLLQRLVGADDAATVRVLVQSEPPAWLRALGVEIVRGSVTSAADVAPALAGVGRVYHLAGLVSFKPEDAHRMYSVHVDGTRVLCAAAAEAGVERIVMASTSGTIAVSRRADDIADEGAPAPLDLISRWPYYASKLYQEEAARRACGDRVELVTVNPSLLLGPGDDRLSSTRTVLQFLAREIPMCPPGGLNFVDVRDVAALLPVAMARGEAGARYLVGGYNWTFEELLGRLERLSKVAAPRLKSPAPTSLLGRLADAASLPSLPLLATRAQAALYRHWGRRVPLEPQTVEMAEYFWYFDSGKAARELGFEARDATDTLHDTVRYIRESFLGNGAFGKKPAA